MGNDIGIDPFLVLQDIHKEEIVAVTALPMLPKMDLKDCSKDELKVLAPFSGHPSYRALQVWRWLYKEGVFDFGAMKNLPASLRQDLEAGFYISKPRLIDSKLSKIDATAKYLLGLEDSNAIEAVYLPQSVSLKATICVSSQVGCKHNCSFCASSISGFVRNLKPREILNEILFIKYVKRLPVTNVVFMGIGEPFDNYDNVMRSIRILNDAEGLNIGARRITVSTCGLIPGIERFAKEGLQCELSVSLHSASDSVRTRLIPVNKRYPLKELMKACRDYVEKTNRVITFEYVLIEALNSGRKDAESLASLLKGMKCKVNLIVYNQIKALGYEPLSKDAACAFRGSLADKGVNVTLRASRGEDIDAGCGQLRINSIGTQ